MILRALIIALMCALPVAAQRADAPLTLPLPEVLSLAQHAHLDAAGFRRVLEAVLPVTIIPNPAPQNAPLDPYLWALSGTFGGDGAHPRAGALFVCARYGLGTRDSFAEHGFATQETFALMRYTRPQSDDPQVWPEGAVARLFCSFIWDDVRVVEIVPEAVAEAVLADAFARLTPLGPDARTPLYGEGGYRLHAMQGTADTVVQIESATVTLTQGHQALLLRSFLMGGGF